MYSFRSFLPPTGRCVTGDGKDITLRSLRIQMVKKSPPQCPWVKGAQAHK